MGNLTLVIRADSGSAAHRYIVDGLGDIHIGNWKFLDCLEFLMRKVGISNSKGGKGKLFFYKIDYFADVVLLKTILGTSRDARLITIIPSAVIQTCEDYSAKEGKKAEWAYSKTRKDHANLVTFVEQNGQFYEGDWDDKLRVSEFLVKQHKNNLRTIRRDSFYKKFIRLCPPLTFSASDKPGA